MDIRVAAYKPSVTVSTVTNSSKSGGTTATSYVQNAAQSAPVPAVNSASSIQGQQRASNEGYTDSVRGSLINILA